MALTPLNLRLEPSELAAIDEARGEVPRTWWIRGAIRQRLERADAPKDAEVIPLPPKVAR